RPVELRHRSRRHRGAGRRPELLGVETYPLRPSSHRGDLQPRDGGRVRHQRHRRLHRYLHHRSHAGRARRRRHGSEDFGHARHRRRGDRPRFRRGRHRRHGVDRRRADRRAHCRHLPRRRRPPHPAARTVRHLCGDGARAHFPSARAVHPGRTAEDLMARSNDREPEGSADMWSRANLFGALAFIAVAAVAPALPPWLVSLATIAFANALVVLGLVILWRAGLVPFGQALFYATGAYAVALLSRYAGWRDVFLLIAAGAAAAGIVAFLVGFLLARYRDIFFAMLSLAMSMILYGVLVKTETLGSTDGFHVESGTFLGYEPRGRAL